MRFAPMRRPRASRSSTSCSRCSLPCRSPWPRSGGHGASSPTRSWDTAWARSRLLTSPASWVSTTRPASCRRSQIVRRRASGHGRMAVVNLPFEATEALLTGYADRVGVAACNGPTSTVISGESDALVELSQLAERRDIFFQFVNVDYASHSPQMDPLRDELLEALGEIDARPTSIAMMSTSGRATLIDGPECNAAYWVSNLRHPVVFAQAIEALIADGCDVLLELSAHPTLATSMSQC